MQIALVSLLLVICAFAEFTPSNELRCASFGYSFKPFYRCYTEQNQIIYQECEISSTNCSYFNLPSSDFPLDRFFSPKDFVHFKISDPGPWDASFCFGFNKTPFDLKVSKPDRHFIASYMRDVKGKGQFWIPGRTKSFSPALWQIPGKRWGKQMEEVYDDFSPFECVSVNVTEYLEFKIVMRNCSDELPMLCIFRGNPFIRSACSHSVALRTTPDRCYQIERNLTAANVETRYENYALMKIGFTAKYLAAYIKLDAAEKCLVYRDPSSGMTVAFNNSGDFETSYEPVEYECAIKTDTVQIHDNIKMFLLFSPTVDSLLLTVYNRAYIWCDETSDPSYDDEHEDDEDSDDRDSECGISCFTNADYEQLLPVKIKKLVWEDANKAIFELKLYGDDPGYYWCEAHSVHNFELVQSAKIVAAKKQKGHPFAFFFHLSCGLVNCTHLNLNMKSYGKTIRNLLIELKEKSVRDRNSSRKFDIHNVRIMNVESVIPGVHITVLCHATISLKGSSVDNSSEEDDSEYIAEVKNKFEREIAIRAHLRQLFGELVARSPYGITISVNSTEFCFSERTPALDRTWQATQLGSSATTEKLCLLPSGLPIFRKCIGDFVYGATWEPMNFRMKCEQAITKKVTTQALYTIDSTKKAEFQPTEAILKVETLINETKKFIPADLFYLGRIMQSVAKTITSTVVQDQGNSNQTQQDLVYYNDLNSTDSVIRIYDNLMDVDRSVLRPSMKLNSTNILLDAFESIFNRIAIQNRSRSVPSGSERKGVIVHRTPKLLAFIIDPNVSNYSGVALFSHKSSNDFKDSHYRLLMPNESKFDLLVEDNLEIGAFVPQKLLDHLDLIPSKVNGSILFSRPPIKIVIKVYFNDKLFQQDRDNIDSFVYSKIISISIPGYDPDLPDHLPLFLKTHKNTGNNSMDSCRYWNYDTWAKEGLNFIAKSATNNNVVMCGCSHLTPFAFLVGESYHLSATSDNVKVTELHRNALDMITILGCSLSLIGIMGIVITFIMFSKFREKPTSKVILNFAIAIALQMILFCFVNTDVLTTYLLENNGFSSCIILGACLHYSVLVQFSWMLIIAYLQYKRYVQVLGTTRPPRFFIKAFLLGWCMPILPVVLVILFDKQSYIPMYNPDQPQVCYPSGLALYLSVLLPIVLITAANLIVFLLIIYNIVRRPKEKIRHLDRNLALSQVRVLLLLFFLLGLTWIFGLLAAAKISLIFSYLFSLTATMQGFVLFIYFIVLDPVTRKLWSGLMKELCCNRNTK